MAGLVIDGKRWAIEQLETGLDRASRILPFLFAEEVLFRKHPNATQNLALDQHERSRNELSFLDFLVLSLVPFPMADMFFRAPQLDVAPGTPNAVGLGPKQDFAADNPTLRVCFCQRNGLTQEGGIVCDAIVVEKQDVIAPCSQCLRNAPVTSRRKPQIFAIQNKPCAILCKLLT